MTIYRSPLRWNHLLINPLITHYLTPEQIHSFGWRIPFVLGSLLCFVGYQIRSKLLDSRYPSQQETLTIEGMPLQSYSTKQRARSVTTLTQQPLDSVFSNLTVKENCLLASITKRSQLQNYLAEFNPKLATHLNTPCKNFSGGEQQALILAPAF
ncbi:MAG: ATP-binding cassette domain-containing protein [Chthoniobacterales bacterium]|nr:ATP-binding cassette domain-containing protein [Chthoniobacterales bacterium]